MFRQRLLFSAVKPSRNLLRDCGREKRLMESEGDFVDRHLASLVAEREKAYAGLFGGSLAATCLTFVSMGLFGLTFGYHAGKAVIDAYGKTRISA
ncbi:uncharacterized protein TEOVI_000489500 [Trypanosoma equiperdum]|uniref:Transmembrane protein n=1 Tax=Trypanosoma equiperdum TaxID=5694 RepID=A0A1G4I3Q1_TRYEQ|nr:hypothetical protein, conserved [Trypanosoma equiperdum]